MKKIFLLIFISVVFCHLKINAQDIDLVNYHPLLSTGDMPDDISKHFYEHIQTRKDELKNENSEMKNYSNDYALNSSYYLNQILKSGKVLFGDPLSKYVNTVADNILQNQPDIRKSVRFYVIRVPIVNAFALDPGVIIITTGLLAQIENEAQLSFVLAHELVHIVKKHSIDLYLTQKKLNKSKEDKSLSMIDSRIFKYHFRSREHENEADRLGLSMYMADSPYDLNIVNGVFDVLQFGHLPFDEKPGFISNLEKDSFSFPKKLIMIEPNLISVNEDEDDTLSTHPNIKNRRSYMTEYIKEFENKDKKFFVQPEALFYQIRDLARFEVINSQILDRNYLEAAYNSFIMLEYMPENIFLQKALVTSLYAISKYKTEGHASKLVADYKKKEGYLYQIFIFFKTISKLEMNVLALRQAWLLYERVPDDVYIYNLCKDLMASLKTQKINIKDFRSKAINANSDTINTDTITYPDSKYGRIKEISQKKTTSKFIDDLYYLDFAFIDILQNPAFADMFNSIKIAEADKSYYDKKKKHKTKRLEIDTFLVFNPYFVKFDERRKNALRIMTSMEKEVKISNNAQSIADKLNLKTHFITAQNFSGGNVEEYNEFCLVSDWLDEYYALDLNFIMPFYQNQYLGDITAKYNTKYINLIAFASLVRKKKFVDYWNLLTMSLAVIPIPYTLYMIFNPSYTSVYNNTLVNVENGNVLYSKSQKFNFNTRRDNVNIRLYDSFNTIRKSKK